MQVEAFEMQTVNTLLQHDQHVEPWKDWDYEDGPEGSNVPFKAMQLLHGRSCSNYHMLMGYLSRRAKSPALCCQ